MEKRGCIMDYLESLAKILQDIEDTHQSKLDEMEEE